LKWKKTAKKKQLLPCFLSSIIHPRSNDGEREHQYHHHDDDDDEDARARAQTSETIPRVVTFIANRLVRVALVLRV